MVRPVEQPRRPSRAQEELEQRRILIVDDEQENLTTASRVLERAGFRVMAFESPEAALAALRQGAVVHAVVTDYRMPGMNGLRFLEILRRERPSLPVIMLTAHGDIDTYFRSFSLGLFEYLNKPYHEAEFVRIVRAAVGRPDQSTRSRTIGF